MKRPYPCTRDLWFDAFWPQVRMVCGPEMATHGYGEGDEIVLFETPDSGFGDYDGITHRLYTDTGDDVDARVKIEIWGWGSYFSAASKPTLFVEVNKVMVLSVDGNEYRFVTSDVHGTGIETGEATDPTNRGVNRGGEGVYEFRSSARSSAGSHLRRSILGATDGWSFEDGKWTSDGTMEPV